MARTLNVEIVGDARNVNRAFGSVGAAARGMGSHVVAAGRIAAGALAGIGAAAGAAAFRGLQEFAKFEQGMAEVFTLLPGISDQAMGQMEQDVKDFAREFGVLTDEVVPALYQALSAGVPQGGVFDFLETAQQAAKGGATDLETAVDGISSVVNAYGPEALSAAEASDLMFTTVKLGKTDFEQLSRSLFNVIPTAASLGVGFDDVSASLAALTAQGVPTSVATTQVRQMLVELGKEGGKTSGIFEDIAGESFPSFVEGGGTMVEALQLMVEHSDATGVRISDLFGSVEAGAAASALAASGSYEDAFLAMQDAAGATEEAFGTMDETLQSDFDRIKANLEVLFIEIGEELAPIAAAALERLVDAWPKIEAAGREVRDWIRDNWPGVRDTTVNVLSEIKGWVEENWPDVRDAIMDVYRPVADWVEENWPKVRDRTVATFEDIKAWVEENWPKVKEDSRSFFEEFKSDAERNLGLARGHWDRFWSGVTGAVESGWAQIIEISDGWWATFGDLYGVGLKTLMGAWERLQPQLSGIIDRALSAAMSVGEAWLATGLGIFQSFGGALKKDWGTTWAGIRGVVDGANKNIVAAVESMWAGIAAAFAVSSSVVQAAWSTFWDQQKQIARDAVRDIIGIVEDLPGVGFLSDTVGGAINSVGGALGLNGGPSPEQEALLSDAVGRAALNKFLEPFGGGVPEFASGGIVTARPGGLIGRIAEAGDDEAIIPLSRLEGMMGGASRGGTHTYNINLPNVRDVDGFIRDFQAWERQNGPLPFATAG